MKTLLLLKGSNSTEHEISLKSAEFLLSTIDLSLFRVLDVLITKDGNWLLGDDEVSLTMTKELLTPDKSYSIDAVIPCFHGFPGETGHIQAMLELMGMPFLGEAFEQSMTCFNKIITKLILENNNIATTPFIQINSSSKESISKVESFYKEHGPLFFKASNQGSSIGCYPVESPSKIKETLIECLKFSDQAVIEKKLAVQELEISVFSHNGEVHVTNPCEINTNGKFYDFDEKYSERSKSTASLKASISESQLLEIKKIALEVFTALNLKRFCRMDFFISDEDTIYLNEVNTFPGLTSISMFPKMIESYGISYKEFLNQQLTNLF